MIIVVVGVTASGKSTIGKLLAQRLGWRFYEGDDLHSPANVMKMRDGVPLTDEDRQPWLESIRELIQSAVSRKENIVIACSALKRSYRRKLSVDDQVRFVFLDASRELIRERLEKRTGHFMHPGLLDSQFDALEAPGEKALRVDAALAPDKIVETVKNRLGLR